MQMTPVITYAAMAYVGVPVMAYTDITYACDAGDNVCGDGVRGHTGDGVHRYITCMQMTPVITYAAMAAMAYAVRSVAPPAQK